MPDDVIWRMLDAMADILVKALRTSARAMLKGKHNRGAVAGSIKKGKPVRKKGVWIQMIRFTGKQHGNRIAEIAFVNEYGKRTQPARPFIKTACEQCEQEAVDAAAEILFDWIDSVN